MSEIPPTKTIVPFGKQGVELTTLEDAFRFATAVSKSGFAPKGVETPEAILIAVQFGAELGLTPMAALQSLAIINGRPSIYGDAALALVRSSGYLESYTQSTTGEGDNQKARVEVKRKGEQPIVAEFSVADAKKAGLWGKAGPWTQYASRMLMWRARGFALRDAFGDVLRGLGTVEENQDLDHDTRLKAAKPVFPKKGKSEPEPETPAVEAHVEVKAEPITPDAPELAEPPAGTGSPSPSDILADLQEVIVREKITLDELSAGLRSASIPHPTRWEGIVDLSDPSLLKLRDSWEVVFATIQAKRKK